MLCLKCKKDYEPTNNNFKKRHFICNLCRRIYDKEWRKKRISLGLKARGEMSKEWHQNYRKEYNQRPEIKERNRLRAIEYRKKRENRIKNLARWALRHAVDRMKIIKKPCEICGDIKVEGHHKDYTKPLDVIWLCRKHHKELHKKERTKNAT